jgi:hypothetical protein
MTKPLRARTGKAMAAATTAVLLAACGAGGTPAPQAGEVLQPTPSPVASAVTAACPAPHGPPGVAMASFRAGVNGACILGSRLLQYRCSAHTAPVIQISAAGSGRHRYRYVGGRFAAIVAGLPSTTRFQGIGPHGEGVYWNPADAAALYVRTGPVTRRWLRVPRLPRMAPAASPVAVAPSPSPTGPASGPHAYFLGDSVLLASQPNVEAGLPDWNVTFDAEIGRTMASGLEIAQAQAPNVREVAVVHLGENDLVDPDFASQVRDLMIALSGADLVLWVNLHESTPLYAQFNDDLREVVAEFPNGVVADWNAVAPPEGIVSDGIHLNALGAEAFGDLILDDLIEWRAVAAARGPAGCATMPVLPSPTVSPSTSATPTA